MDMHQKGLQSSYIRSPNTANPSFSLLRNGLVVSMLLLLLQDLVLEVFYYSTLIIYIDCSNLFLILGLIAACWATMMYYGRTGYVEATKKIVQTQKFIENGYDGFLFPFLYKF